jgi:hypothetical protein
MRDMLESLSEVKDLGKIEMLRSVIKIAVTRVDECAKFIDSYAQHGFWGEFAHSPAVTCLIERGVGRLPRQSLSSHTADTIQRFQNAFAKPKQIFNDAVSVQTPKIVAATHPAFEDVMQTFNDAGHSLVDIGKPFHDVRRHGGLTSIPRVPRQPTSI